MALLNKIRTRHGRSPVTPDVLAAADAAVAKITGKIPDADQDLIDKKTRQADRARRLADLESTLRSQLNGGAPAEAILATEKAVEETRRAVQLEQRSRGGHEERKASDLRTAEHQARYLAMRLHRSVLCDELDPLLDQIADLIGKVNDTIASHPPRSDAHPIYDGLGATSQARLIVLDDLDRVLAGIRGEWPRHVDRVHDIATSALDELPS